jgi:hypothetical protein
LPTLLSGLLEESLQGPLQVSRGGPHGTVEEDQLLPLDDQRGEVFHIDVAELIYVRFNVQPAESCHRELPGNFLEALSVFPANATPFGAQAYDDELVGRRSSFTVLAGSLLIDHFQEVLALALAMFMVSAP